MEIEEENKDIIKNVTFTGLEANLYGILFFIPSIIIFGLPYVLIWGSNSLEDGLEFYRLNILYFTVIFILGIVFHEAIHGITWARYCKYGMGSIKFGIKWKFLTPYAHCKEILKVNQYRIGCAMPGVLLGVIPSIIALLIGNGILMCFGLLFSIAASGDMIILWYLRKYNKSYLMKDHPDEIGFMVMKSNEN